MINVLLVDQHRLIRDGLKCLFAGAQGLQVVADLASAEEALQLLRGDNGAKHPNILLIDIKSTAMDGLELVRRLLRQDPDLKILITTTYSNYLFPVRLLQAGAVGYITQQTGFSDILQAIQKVNAGQRYISSEMAQHIALQTVTDESDDSPIDSLTERELQVMAMISTGLRVQDISDRLCLSPKTVNTYRYRLFEKLKVNNDVELTHIAIKYKLLSDEHELYS